MPVVDETRQIHVIGHTDNVKPKLSSAFKSNFDLSVARAKSVEAVLGKSLTDPTRIQIEGKFIKGTMGTALVERGLRAQLVTQSLVTGQASVEFDFYPGTEARLTHL